MILLEVEAARSAARRAADVANRPFGIGFLTGYESVWLPHVVSVLREISRDIEFEVHSKTSLELAEAVISRLTTSST
jgi:LysR family hca operon transcriptional activator